MTLAELGRLLATLRTDVMGRFDALERQLRERLDEVEAADDLRAARLLRAALETLEGTGESVAG